MSSIGLVMIVKDETDVMRRCLGSVKDLISYWVVCDTGSTDGTQDLIRAELEGIPGELHQRPWVNFGHNRSESLAYARGKADYLLLLDADWTFSYQRGALDRLGADIYMVEHRHQGYADFELHNRHLVRGDRVFRYVGVTHEHIQMDGKPKEKRLQNAFITNWSDGGVGRERRWRQDAELLEASLKKNPKNLRERFYLAQTYRDLGETQRAIDEYARRAKAGGWDQEVFYALYQIGVLNRKLGDWPEAERWLKRAYEYRPMRIEPLFHLAAGYRERQNWEQAHRYAVKGLNKPLPDDILFVEPWIYRWGMLFEYSVAVHYVGDTAAALQASDQLLARDDLSDEYRGFVHSNREFYRTSPGHNASTFSMGDKRVVISLPTGSQSRFRR